jgi:hypothetical protein
VSHSRLQVVCSLDQTALVEDHSGHDPRRVDVLNFDL